jgi:superfamily II DNA helicase RecQ
MQFEVFTVPAGGGEAMVELNRFLSIHRVIGVENHLVTAQGGGPVWVFCVEYLRGAGMEGRTAGGGAAVGKVDYREVRSAEDFAVVSKLREVRKGLAEKEGVPPYTIFTNEQLAAVVRQKVTTKAALEKVEGVGAARLEKYRAAERPLRRMFRAGGVEFLIFLLGDFF